MKKNLSFVFLLLTACALSGQEMLGIINSNYSGVSCVAINPSYLTDSKLYMDINFLSGGASLQTDLIKNAYANFRLNTPSFMLNRGDYGFAFFTAARAAISYKKISLKQGAYTEYQVAGIAWGEAGLSIAKVFKRFDKSVWSGGISLKGLFGAGGAYYSNTTINYSENSTASQTMNNSGITSGGGGMGVGKGIAGDIGICYQKKMKKETVMPFTKLCQQKYNDYKYRSAFSIIDIGFLRFKSDANNSTFNRYLVDTINYIHDSVIIVIPTDSLNNYNNSSLYKNKYSVYLPAGFCFQFDYHLTEHWYFNWTFVKGMNLSPEFVRRPTLIAFTPRYQKRWFEVNFPVSVSDLKYYRIGISVRFWNFIIGTDNLPGSLGAGMNVGADIYFSLKMNFRKGKCGRKHGGVFEPFRQLFK